MPDARTRRIAENEARFRAINERLRGELEALGGGDDPIGFVCECARVDCRAVLEIVPSTYRAVREHPLRFMVAPGHELPDVERVVERHDPGYLVIEKPEEVAEILT